MANAVELGKELAEVFPEIDPRGIRKGQVSDAVVKRMNKVLSLENTLSRMGVPPCTIVNLNPYELHIDAPHLDHIRVPACPPGRPYSVYVVRKHSVAWNDEGEDNWSPLPILPAQIGDEFARHYFKNGGVFAYDGDGSKVPPASNEALKEKITEAKQRQYAYAEAKVAEANAMWNTTNHEQAKAITPEIHCALAKVLHDERGDELPAWVNRKPGEYGLGTKCRNCSAIPPTAAVICPNCGDVLDPEKAYMENRIGENHFALARLSREKLESLGITKDHIPETNEERAARIAAIQKKQAKAGK